MTRVDLNDARPPRSARTWARDGPRQVETRGRWRTSPREPLWVNGDLSHLQQAVENLLFNARDATFEMRNYLRDEATRGDRPGPRAGRS